jgi:hypothetical protein
VWWIISAVGIAALKAFCFRGKNAVWGGATIGVLVGVVIALIRPSFDWEVIGHSAVIGAFAGLVAEELGWIGDRLRSGL